jgi:hypothetical protein
MEITMTSIAGLGGSAGAQHASRGKPPTFDALDTNQDGSVSSSELTAALTQNDASGKASDKASKLFSAMDTDGNGSVSKTEMQAFSAKQAERLQSNQFAAQMLAGLQPTGSTPTGTSASAPADLLAALNAYTSGSSSGTTTPTDPQSLLSGLLNAAA